MGGVSAVLGGAQLIGGIVSSNAQAKAQAQATQAQIQSSVDGARLRTIEILQAQDNANYAATVNSLTRQQGYAQAVSDVQFQKKKEELDAQSVAAQANNQRLNTLLQTSANRGQIAEQTSNAELSLEGAIQQAAQYVTGIVNQGSQALTGVEQQVNETTTANGMRDALYAASGLGVGSQTSEQNQANELRKAQLAFNSVGNTTAKEQALAQYGSNASVGVATNQVAAKKSQLRGLLSEADAQDSISNLQYGQLQQNILSQTAINDSARQNALLTLDQTNFLNQNTEEVNKQLASAGYSVQNTANANQLSNQIAASVANYNPTSPFISLLNSGMGAYNTYTQAQQNASFLGGR
jgi:hypothetical protein